MPGTDPTRRFWGWGREADGPTPEHQRAIAQVLAARFDLGELTISAPPRLEELALPAPRVAPPAALAPFCSAAPLDRAAHTYGKSFRDVVRGLRREYPHPPDLVAFPAGETEVAAVLDWATGARVAVIPYGGGSSVVGGIEPVVGDRYRGAVSLDLSRLDRVLEVDRSSRAARIQAGVLGPALEEQLRPHGLTLRHFPQSFEFSSLGGWIAPARADTTRPSTPTSTTSWNRSAWSRLRAPSPPAGSPAPAPGRARTGSSSARRASSA